VRCGTIRVHTFLEKLDKRLDDLYGRRALHPDRTRVLGMEPPKSK
jgi:hypothetical protein